MKKVFIFSNRIARDLIRKRYNIIDLAENQKDKERTVFVFEGDKKLISYLKDNHGIKITL